MDERFAKPLVLLDLIVQMGAYPEVSCGMILPALNRNLDAVKVVEALVEGVWVRVCGGARDDECCHRGDEILGTNGFEPDPLHDHRPSSEGQGVVPRHYLPPPTFEQPSEIVYGKWDAHPCSRV